MLIQLYNIAKFNPASDDYRALAHRILQLPERMEATFKLQHDIYKAYLGIARPSARLNGERLLHLASQFAAGNYLDDAEKLIGTLVKRKWSGGALSQTVFYWPINSIKFNLTQTTEKRRHYLALLVSDFPDSAEAASARQLLQTS